LVDSWKVKFLDYDVTLAPLRWTPIVRQPEPSFKV
jgi:hypothetical protein